MDEASAAIYADSLAAKVQELTEVFGQASDNGRISSPFEDLMTFLQMRVVAGEEDAKAAFARFVEEDVELPKIIADGRAEALYHACIELLTEWGYVTPE